MRESNVLFTDVSYQGEDEQVEVLVAKHLEDDFDDAMHNELQEAYDDGYEGADYRPLAVLPQTLERLVGLAVSPQIFKLFLSVRLRAYNWGVEQRQEDDGDDDVPDTGGVERDLT
jgi:hypothetical protein